MLRALQVLGALGALAVGSGCANPLNAAHAERYLAAGLAAEERGDLAMARQHYHRMYRNSEFGRLGPAAEAASLYEWARVSGYLGYADDVEWAFPKIFTLIDRAKGEANYLRPPALAEFSRYLHDTGQHERAVPVFRDAVNALEGTKVVSADPIGFAEFLDNYAKSLKMSGSANEAAAVSARADSLRNAHPGRAAVQKIKRYPATPVVPAHTEPVSRRD